MCHSCEGGNVGTSCWKSKYSSRKHFPDPKDKENLVSLLTKQKIKRKYTAI